MKQGKYDHGKKYKAEYALKGHLHEAIEVAASLRYIDDGLEEAKKRAKSRLRAGIREGEDAGA